MDFEVLFSVHRDTDEVLLVFNIINSHANIHHQTPGSSVPITNKSNKSSDRLGQVTKGSVHSSLVKARQNTVIIETKIRPSEYQNAQIHSFRQKHKSRQKYQSRTPWPCRYTIPPSSPPTVLTVSGGQYNRGESGCTCHGCRQDGINKTKRAH